VEALDDRPDPAVPRLRTTMLDRYTEIDPALGCTPKNLRTRRRRARWVSQIAARRPARR
jgi:hypothetical protein